MSVIKEAGPAEAPEAAPLGLYTEVAPYDVQSQSLLRSRTGNNTAERRHSSMKRWGHCNSDQRVLRVMRH